MNINLTLIGQSITFALFVWFCYAFIWPPLVNALEKRKKQIADGLAAAERGQHEQELAEKKAAEQLKNAKGQAAEIIAQAQKRATEIVDKTNDCSPKLSMKPRTMQGPKLNVSNWVPMPKSSRK